MHPLRSAFTAALLLGAAGPAFAQSAEPTPPARAPAGTEQVAHEPVGTTLQLEFIDAPSSRTSHRGDTFTLKVAQAATVGDAVVIPAGALARGEVIEAIPSDSGGQPGMLVLSIQTLDLNGQSLPLISPTLALSGQDNIDSVRAASLFVSPLLHFIEGRDIAVQAGTRIEVALAGAVEDAQEPGQIVFFRPRRSSAGAYRYGVREGESEVRLRNGTYFTMDVSPGIHEFELIGTYFGGAPDQTLRLSVQSGETLYVEHAISFLVVSGRAAFEAHRLRPHEEAR